MEIDNLLCKHKAISEAVAFAVPDDMYGEEVRVAVVFHPNQSATPRELKSWGRSQVSAHKVPAKVSQVGFMDRTSLTTSRQFFFPEALPKTATGKLQRLSVASKMLQSA